MVNVSKASERMAVSPAGNWVSMSGYFRVMAVGLMDDADATEGVTVQLRKATDASGTNAANFGDAVTVVATGSNEDVQAIADGHASGLGLTGGGLQYSHVSAVISKAGSPAPAEAVYGVVIRMDGRGV